MAAARARCQTGTARVYRKYLKATWNNWNNKKDLRALNANSQYDEQY